MKASRESWLGDELGSLDCARYRRAVDQRYSEADLGGIEQESDGEETKEREQPTFLCHSNATPPQPHRQLDEWIRMLDWSARRSAIQSLLPEISALVSAQLSASEDSIVQLALELPNQEANVVVESLRKNVLSVADFRVLSTLATPGPFSRVELVRIRDGLSRTGGSGVFVLKTLERRWGFRMQAQQSPWVELAISRLSLKQTGIPIPKLVASFLSPTHFHLVLSHAAGGDLNSLLERQNLNRLPGSTLIGLEEVHVKRWSGEVVEALEWLHGEGYAHRDIKPANILINADGRLLLTDFGSAAPLAPDNSVSRKYARALVGTPDYIAPEVLIAAEELVRDDSFDTVTAQADGEERAYGSEVDWWSLGVTIFELLYGSAPFFAESIAETYERIIESTTVGSLAFPSDSVVSTEAQSLIRKLLTRPDLRPTTASIKEDPWFTGQPWGTSLRNAPPLFVPPPFDLPSILSSPSINNSNASAGFDFSAFFSSPGLSILRPSPNTLLAAQREEQEYWLDMTTLPAADAFERITWSLSASERNSNPIVPPPKVSAPDPAPPPHFFKTPARQLSSMSLLRTQYRMSTPAPASSEGSSGRSKRLISDVEAWKEMQEYAWEVGMTARKKGVVSRPEWTATESPITEKLQRLAKRQKGVLDELDGLEEKYQKLFSLAKTVG